MPLGCPADSTVREMVEQGRGGAGSAPGENCSPSSRVPADHIRRDRRPQRQVGRGRVMQDVNGKVALITGGGSGMGLGMARAFTAAGMKVVIADLRQDHLDEALVALKSAK